MATEINVDPEDIMVDCPACGHLAKYGEHKSYCGQCNSASPGSKVSLAQCLRYFTYQIAKWVPND